jgi:hypothetical protein
MFCSSGVLEGYDDITKVWRMVGEDLIGNDAHFVKVGGCPQKVEYVNGNGWEFRFFVPISGTPIGSGIPIPFSIPEIPV